MNKRITELTQLGQKANNTLKSVVWAGFVCLFFLLFFGFGAKAQGVQVKLDESIVRAYVVVAILKYTQWESAGDPIEELTLCSQGEPLSKDYLSKAVSSLAHPHVSQFTYYDLDENQSRERDDGGEIGRDRCDVLVVGPDYSGAERPSSSSQEGSAALFICDGADSAQSADACAVQLGLTRGKVSFTVNLTTAETSGAVFSSSLLELAEKIEGRR